MEHSGRWPVSSPLTSATSENRVGTHCGPRSVVSCCPLPSLVYIMCKNSCNFGPVFHFVKKENGNRYSYSTGHSFVYAANILDECRAEQAWDCTLNCSFNQLYCQGFAPELGCTNMKGKLAWMSLGTLLLKATNRNQAPCHLFGAWLNELWYIHSATCKTTVVLHE